MPNQYLIIIYSIIIFLSIINLILTIVYFSNGQFRFYKKYSVGLIWFTLLLILLSSSIVLMFFNSYDNIIMIIMSSVSGLTSCASFILYTLGLFLHNRNRHLINDFFITDFENILDDDGDEKIVNVFFEKQLSNKNAKYTKLYTEYKDIEDFIPKMYHEKFIDNLLKYIINYNDGVRLFNRKYNKILYVLSLRLYILLKTLATKDGVIKVSLDNCDDYPDKYRIVTKDVVENEIIKEKERDKEVNREKKREYNY